MILRVLIEKTVGKNCASIDDGEKVFELVSPEIAKNLTVEIDFKGVKLMLTPFLNACFGKLLERFGKERTMANVSIRNVPNDFLRKINEFIDQKDKEYTQASEREMLEELFDEDGLTDSYS
ncbi:MAG: STAS-like domain-containing protein [Flavobacteriaceae bacterium]|nr:STAS-like domain-containing protein [bacterium]MBT5975286.1 STAS-like domain-containing protein [Flavobacteriaceae bacterium]